MSLHPFPLLETDRLILREITEMDVDAVFVLRSDPEMMRFIPRKLSENKEDALKLIRQIRLGIQKKESLNWAITLKTDNTLIGTIGFVRMQAENFRAEIGYMLHTQFHKQGIMGECLKQVLQIGFERLGLHSIEGIVDPDNIASARLLESSGFTKEAHFKENFYFNGKFLDSVHYCLLDREAKQKG